MTVFSFFLQFSALPLVASQILWKNLLSDSIPAVALSSSSNAQPDDIPQFPEGKSLPLLNRKHAIFIILASASSAAAGLILFWLQLSVIRSGVDYARSVVFAFIIVAALLYVFPTRYFPNPARIRKTLEGSFVRIAFGVSLLLAIFAFSVPFLRSVLHLVPITPGAWIMVITLALLVTMVVEVIKRGMFKTTSDLRRRCQD